MSWIIAEPYELLQSERFFVVPSALDNQWVDNGLLDYMIEKQKPLTEVEDARDRLARNEYMRALINSPRLVINRAFVYNHPAVAQDYREKGSRDYLDFQELVNKKIICPYLMHETDPTQPAAFERRDDFDAWIEFCRESGTNVTCVRLSKDDSNNTTEVAKQLYSPFHEFVQNMNVKARFWAAHFGLRGPESDSFGRILAEIGAAARKKYDIEGKYFTRTDVYREWIVADEKQIAKPTFASHSQRPFGAFIKRLTDLRYNCSLPDALGGYPLTAPNSDRRTLLAETQGQAAHMSLSEIVDQVIGLGFDQLQSALNFPLLSKFSLCDIIALRETNDWKDYAIAARALITPDPDPMQCIARFAQGFGQVADAYGKVATRGAEILQNRRRENIANVAQQAIPFVGVAFDFGGAALEVLWSPTAGKVVRLIGKAVSLAPAGAAKLVARCIVRGAMNQADREALSLNNIFMNVRLNHAQEEWKALVAHLKARPGLPSIEIVEEADSAASVNEHEG